MISNSYGGQSKYVSRQGYTSQLKDTIQIAKNQGKKMVLVVKMNTKISRVLQGVVDKGEIILHFFGK